MAARESQGLQIALILFVLITIALSVTTFVYYRASEEKTKEAAAARESQARERQTAEQALFRVQALKSMVGWGDTGTDGLEDLPGMDDEMQEIIKAFNADMAAYGEGLPEEDRNYRNLPRNMETAIRERNSNLVESNLREQSLVAEKENITQRETQRADMAEAALQKAADDYAKERAEFVNYKTSMKTDFDKMLAENEQKVDRYKQEQTKLSNEKDVLAKEVNTLTNLLAGARERIEQLRTTDFESPDGVVTNVNQRSRTVWINLGMADGLRRQTTFAVYDRDEAGVMNPDRKGAVEVTRVIDQHLAEARILEDDLKTPILPGDLIHSPAWRPGKVHFALAGFMDINDDGESDRQLIRNLITMSGGVIDAEVHDDGSRTGALTNRTRYLIRGERPSETSGPAAIQGYSEMDRDARNMSIESIILDEFLTYIGWKGEVRTVQLGRGSRSEDFAPKPAGGVNRKSTGATSDFRERRPSRGGNGAFP